MDAGIFLKILTLVLSCLAILFSLLILLFILISIRPLKSNVALILTCNTYFALIVSSTIQCQNSSINIHFTFQNSTLHEIPNCQISGYFINIAFGGIFYSLVLHAFYHLARIVFFQKKSLYSLRVLSIAIFLQWIMVFLINLFFALLHLIEYIPSEYRCQVSYSNFYGTLLVLIIEYTIPSIIVFTIYFQIIRYIRQRNNVRRIRHDIIIFKQIIILLVIVNFLSIPLIILWILYDVISFKTPLCYQIQAVSLAFSQCFIPILLAFFTPRIREKLKWYLRQQRQIHPIN